MTAPTGSSRGVSLIEMLVVLVILGVLAVAGVSMIGNRGAGSVRTVMDELEGTLMSAQKLAVATGQDVTLASQGDWDPASATPMILARTTNSTLAPAAIIAQGLTDPASFLLDLVYHAGIATGLARDHAYAGVVTVASAGWWATAMGAMANGRQNQDLTTVEPFKDQAGFTGILGTSTQNLFQGGAASATGTLQVSGTNKRFTSTTWIEVVGLANGGPYPGAPMGLLVVQANGGTVFKFYNPGVANGNGLWRRI
jgi:prepilin-type N-terminal cleavage/methylation domain-containing protein